MHRVSAQGGNRRENRHRAGPRHPGGGVYCASARRNRPDQPDGAGTGRQNARQTPPLALHQAFPTELPGRMGARGHLPPSGALHAGGRGEERAPSTALRTRSSWKIGDRLSSLRPVDTRTPPGLGNHRRVRRAEPGDELLPLYPRPDALGCVPRPLPGDRAGPHQPVGGELEHNRRGWLSRSGRGDDDHRSWCLGAHPRRRGEGRRGGGLTGHP